jgi:hypothetical protein
MLGQTQIAGSTIPANPQAGTPVAARKSGRIAAGWPGARTRVDDVD